jgi:hypothetical protein
MLTVTNAEFHILAPYAECRGTLEGSLYQYTQQEYMSMTEKSCSCQNNNISGVKIF